MKELRTRLLLGTLLVAAVAGIFAADRGPVPGLAATLVAVLALAAQQEFYGMLRAAGEQPRRFAGAAMGVAVLAGTAAAPDAAGAWMVGAAAAYLAGEVLTRRPAGAPRRIGATLIGWIAVPVLLSAMIEIRTGVPDGWRWLLFLVVVCKAGDSAAYLVGSSLGRRPLIPAVSPAKTWEGAAGSLAGGLAGGGVVAAWAFGGRLEPALWLGAAAATNVGAQCGDLVESLLKRGCASKDSARVLPAFGGTFDLVDSFLIAAPVLLGVLHAWGAA